GRDARGRMHERAQAEPALGRPARGLHPRHEQLEREPHAQRGGGIAPVARVVARTRIARGILAAHATRKRRIAPIRPCGARPLDTIRGFLAAHATRKRRIAPIPPNALKKSSPSSELPEMILTFDAMFSAASESSSTMSTSVSIATDC